MVEVLVADHPPQLGDGGDLGELAHLVVGPPRCPRRDLVHLIERETAGAEHRHRARELVDAFGDLDDLASHTAGDTEVDREPLRQRVDSGTVPVTIACRPGGQVDQASVLDVQQPGDLSESIFDVDALGPHRHATIVHTFDWAPQLDSRKISLHVGIGAAYEAS